MSDNDLLNIFKQEVAEYLQTLNGALLQAEIMTAADPTYRQMLVEMNRVSHSMKGAARAVGIGIIETVAHYMEEVFNAALNQTLRLTPETADILYDTLDLIQNVMDGAEQTEGEIAGLLQRLEQIITTSSMTDSQQVAVLPTVTAADPTDAAESSDDDIEDHAAFPEGDYRTGSDDPHTEAPRELHPGALTTLPQADRALPAATHTGLTPMIEGQATIALRTFEDTIRIPVSKLDRLMAEATELLVARMHSEERQRMVAELRRAHNRWQREWRTVRAAYVRLVRRLQDTADQPGIESQAELQALLRFMEVNQRYLSETARRLTLLAQASGQDNAHLSALADQLQDDISAMRLVPFESIVGGFQRMVRDLARDMNKHLQLDVVGAFVEIDKTVLDALKDPLLHLVRNAVDHGIEAPGERERRGKSPVGRVVLAVEQRGSEIILRVMDDGRGINVQNVRRAIVRQGLLNETEAMVLSDEDTYHYIFHPGLSTSEAVTTISGRGYGMDIVRDRVESLRGRVSVHSESGAGTTITISVPVSLTRIRCIVVGVGDQRFAVPSVVVRRMEELPRAAIFTAEGQEMAVINGQPVSVVSLGALLDIPGRGIDQRSVQLVSMEAAGRIVAFEVDHLYSELELVLKPLGRELARSRFVSGAALLGTGDVIVVLDANNLVRAASGAATLPRRMLASASPAQRRLRVLVVDDSITTRTLEKNILETAGFEVHVAIDGVEAWGMLLETEFDLVISDVEMPKMNGLELTARMKESAQHRDIPLVLLTSLSKPEQREAGLRAGADAYLVKSRFDQAELLQTLQALL